MKKVSLDDIMLSQATYDAWQQIAQQTAEKLRRLEGAGRVIPPIPEEQAWVNDDGTLTIFVSITGLFDVVLQVSADHWSYRQ